MRPADYALADKTYAEWLHKLRKDDFEHLTPAVRQHLLRFYEAAATAGPATPVEEAEAPDKQEKRELREDVEALRALP